MHRIGVGQAVGHQGMSAFVIGHALLFVGMHHPLPFFQSGDDSLHSLVELRHGHRGLVRPGGQQGGLVYQVGQIGADKAGSDLRHFLQIDRRDRA